MHPITEDQEFILRNWVSTFGRPGQLDKAFLREKKGLSEDQVEFWWSRHQDLYSESASPIQVANGDPIDALDQHSIYSAPDQSQNVNPFSDFFFDIPASSLNLLPASTEEDVQVWSPIGPSRNGFFDASLMEALEQNNPWSTMDCLQESSMSTIPPLSETELPPIEPSNNHWTYMSGSDRSSCVSYESSRTWNTSSTLVSFPDLYSDDQAEAESLNPDQVTSPGRLPNVGIRALPRFLGSDTIKEEHCICSSLKTETPVKATRGQPVASKNPSSVPAITQKPLKGQGKYACTACKFAFPRKGDWERHEDSKHDPQTFWTCMLGNDPAIQKPSGWSCAFCNVSKPNRDDMVEHLKEHKISQCTSKDYANRTWTRKDKLKQHLQQVHSLSESANHWEHWHRPASRKGAWGCGFCGACSFTWEGRLIHIAEHYESKQPPDVSKWCSSLVIKGLLKQCQKNFNMALAWKGLIGQDLHGDKLLEWSKQDAAALKRKLEFHEGTPREIAAEARKLAKNPYAALANSGWIAPDSRGPTLSAPWNFVQPSSSLSTSSKAQTDSEMSNYI